MNKKKIGGLVAIVAGVSISYVGEGLERREIIQEMSTYYHMGSHMLVCAGAYVVGSENMREKFKTINIYTRAGLSRIGITYDEK